MGIYSMAISDLDSAISNLSEFQNLPSNIGTIQTTITQATAGLGDKLTTFATETDDSFTPYVTKFNSLIGNWSSAVYSDVKTLVTSLQDTANLSLSSISTLLSTCNEVIGALTSSNKIVENLIQQTNASIASENSTLASDQADVSHWQDVLNNAAADPNPAGSVAYLALYNQAQAAVSADNSQIATLNSQVTQQSSLLGAAQKISDNIDAIIKQINCIENDLNFICGDINNVLDDATASSDMTTLKIYLVAACNNLNTLITDIS